MLKPKSRKLLSMLVALTLTLCTISPIGTVLAAKSKYVPPANLNSYGMTAKSPVIKIDFGLRNWGPDTFTQGELQAWWLKNYKIDLTMDAIPAGSYEANLNARIAAKDAPDVWFVQNRAMLYKYADQGVTIGNLESLIKQNMPTLSKALEPADWNSAKTSDGALVGVPFRPDTIEWLWYVRKDWLDKLKLPVPKTLDDIYKVATAFTKNDPDGNGKADTYGIGECANFVQNAVCSAYGVFGSAAGASWQVRNGKLVWDLTTPEYKQAMQWWAKAVGAGLVNPDWPTATNDVYSAALASGKFGIGVGPSWWCVDPWQNGLKRDPKMNWVGIPNLLGPSGKRVAPQQTPVTNKWMVLNKNLLNDPAKLKRVFVFLDQLMCTSNEGQMITAIGTTLGTKIDKKAKYWAEVQTDSWWFKKSMTFASIRDFCNFLDQPKKGIRIMQAPPRYTMQAVCYHQSKGIDCVENLFDIGEISTLAPDRDKFIGASLMSFAIGKTPFSQWDGFVSTVMDKYKGTEIRDIFVKQLQKLGVSAN